MRRLFAAVAAVLAWTSVRADFEVLFLRHGETSWNRAKVLQGSVSDTDLTVRGVRMAERTAEGLKAAGVRALRQSGLWVSLWFVQSAADAARCRETEADAYVTDHVSAVRAADKL